MSAKASNYVKLIAVQWDGTYVMNGCVTYRGKQAKRYREVLLQFVVTPTWYEKAYVKNLANRDLGAAELVL